MKIGENGKNMERIERIWGEWGESKQSPKLFDLIRWGSYSINQLIKKHLLQNVFCLVWGFLNRFWKQEMELSKQEMEIFLPLPDFWLKNFFYKMFFIQSEEFKTGFRNRKWNYLNRKWNYFSHFQSSDQKTSFTKVSPIGPTIPKWFSETGNGIISTGNGIISPLSSHKIKKLF